MCGFWISCFLANISVVRVQQKDSEELHSITYKKLDYRD